MLQIRSLLVIVWLRWHSQRSQEFSFSFRIHSALPQHWIITFLFFGRDIKPLFPGDLLRIKSKATIMWNTMSMHNVHPKYWTRCGTVPCHMEPSSINGTLTPLVHPHTILHVSVQPAQPTHQHWKSDHDVRFCEMPHAKC